MHLVWACLRSADTCNKKNTPCVCQQPTRVASWQTNSKTLARFQTAILLNNVKLTAASQLPARIWGSLAGRCRWWTQKNTQSL